ncbi:MAG: hypothetical protein ACREGD_01795 [Candidatus Saccharimonadales bacterium]
MIRCEPFTSDWLPENGPHAEYVAGVATRGLVSVFSSGAAHHFSQKQGVPSLRKPDDLDLLVGDDAFLEAFWTLAPERRKLIPVKSVRLTSADGARLSLVADEITGWPHASGEGPEIQIMRPLGPVKCETRDGSVNFYDTRLDETLAAHNVNDGSLPYLHPKAGAMFYAMYQRPYPKLDAHNALILERAAAGMVSSYEVGELMVSRGFGEPRVQRMLHQLGTVATVRSDILIAA